TTLAIAGLLRAFVPPRSRPPAQHPLAALRLSRIGAIALGGILVLAVGVGWTRTFRPFVATSSPSESAAEQRLRAAFFDPDHIVWSWTEPAASPEAALHAAALDARILGEALPREDARLKIDGPGNLV